MRAIVLAIRIMLAIVLVIDIPVIIELFTYLVKGGFRGFDDRMVNIALAGKPVRAATVAEVHNWIAHAYQLLAAWLVAPIVLYFSQRRLSSRIETQTSK